MANTQHIDIRQSAQRVRRVTDIYFHLDRLFEDDNAMFDWLTRPAPAFGSAYPVDLLRTDDGVEKIYTALTRMEYGVYG